MVNKNKSRNKLPVDKDGSLLLFSIDDCPESVPAAGYCNGSSRNNVGENGNYWSSTPNESNTNNAYNLNFNSGNHNVNWNNRNNGHTVRPVSELTQQTLSLSHHRHFVITKDQLLVDLYRAYKDARKHKRGRAYQLKFEYNLEENLVALRDELFLRTYTPLPSNCFVIHDPKMREVFAANFRDRIVHHLFYNYTHTIFERTFVHDSYSCIKNRGTHFGIERLKHHIRSVSAGYSKPCYVLKIDIRGYFMNINRKTLLFLCRQSLAKMKNHNADKEGKAWNMLIDYSFVDYLLETIINTNPIENCNMLGNVSDWNNLPTDKSLFHSRPDCGLPIGNLSSQLFSNVYMNVFDQYVKRVLGCKHYGRYVDDAYIVSDNRVYLKSLIPLLDDFLHSSLDLALHPHKTRVIDVRYGVEFLGAYLKPFRTYVSSSSLKRIKKSLQTITNDNDYKKLKSSINSYLGVLSHYNSYCLRRVLFGYNGKLNRLSKFSSDWHTFGNN